MSVKYFSQQKLLSAAEGAGALFITPVDRLDSEFFQKVSPTVKIIATYSVGFEHIDLEAAARRKIPVAYTPGVNRTQHVAQPACAKPIDRDAHHFAENRSSKREDQNSSSGASERIFVPVQGEPHDGCDERHSQKARAHRAATTIGGYLPGRGRMSARSRAYHLPPLWLTVTANGCEAIPLATTSKL